MINYEFHSSPEIKLYLIINMVEYLNSLSKRGLSLCSFYLSFYFYLSFSLVVYLDVHMIFVILRKGHQFNVNGISSPPWSTPWNGEKDLPWIPFLQHIYIHYLFGSLLRIPLNLAVKNNRNLTKKYNKNNISHISYNVSSIKWKDGFIMLIHVSKAIQDRRNGLAPPCLKIFWGLVF